MLVRLQTIISPKLIKAQYVCLEEMWYSESVVGGTAEYTTPLYLCFVDLPQAFQSPPSWVCLQYSYTGEDPEHSPVEI